MKDLLDAKWKGKMSIAGTTTGTQWIGAMIETFGREFLEKIAGQEINVQNISGAALAQLVASGEVPLSPTIFNSNITVAKQKGAPVEWSPIDPVIAHHGHVGNGRQSAASPCRAAISRFSPFKRRTTGGGERRLKFGAQRYQDAEMKFKKVYIESKYPPEVMEKKFGEWEGLKRKLFISKR